MLDTNVLMHDPAAIFRFDEHDIYLPMVVLEELDHHKKGLSEPARNVRQVSRFLDEIMSGADKAQIDRRPAHSHGAVGEWSGSSGAEAPRLRVDCSSRPATCPASCRPNCPARRRTT